MARSNVIEFARSFQESFQRQQQIEIQRQREERFNRQLIANADFQQSQLNLQRQRFGLEQQRFERGTPTKFQAINTGDIKSIFDPVKGTITPTEAQSSRVAGDDTSGLPGKFTFGKSLKESGVTGREITERVSAIPPDLDAEAATAFDSARDFLPFFEQTTFGFGKTKFGAQPFVKNVSQKEIQGPFIKFLQDTQFAAKTENEQGAILRAFDNFLGVDETDGRTSVPRDEVDFDLQSEFFQSIIKREGNPIGKIIERGGKQFKVTGHDKDGEPLVDEVK